MKRSVSSIKFSEVAADVADFQDFQSRIYLPEAGPDKQDL